MFGEIMNFSTWVSFSDHSFRAFVAIATSAFPFDVAHAAGNAVFALAFGPALLRAIARFRERFEVTWKPGAAAAAAPVLVAAVLLVAAASPDSARAASSVAYLQSAQNSDGGWGAGPGQSSSQLLTGWVSLGLAASGRNPQDVSRGGKSAIDYVRKGAPGITDIGELERTILV